MLRALLITLSLTGVATVHAGAGFEAKAQRLIASIEQAQATASAQASAERGEALGARIHAGMYDSMPAGIADPQMAEEWEAVREGLGIASKNQLYIFASFSMPESLLRAYALDAARAGGILVFRGVTEGMDLHEFLATRLSLLVRPGLAATPIQIDPRLFDAYRIERVPTLVLAESQDGPTDNLCSAPEREYVEIDGTRVPYDRCPAQEDEAYWKLSGSVTALYALEQFEKHGAANAERFIKALREAGADSVNEQAELSAERWETLAEQLIGRNRALLD